MHGKTSADGTKSCLQMQMNTIKTRLKNRNFTSTKYNHSSSTYVRVTGAFLFTFPVLSRKYCSNLT